MHPVAAEAQAEVMVRPHPAAVEAQAEAMVLPQRAARQPQLRLLRAVALLLMAPLLPAAVVVAGAGRGLRRRSIR